jgi:triosephosphate isomerase
MPTKKPRLSLIAGNWKMFKTLDEARALATAVTIGQSDLGPAPRLRIGLFPPAVSLSDVARAVRAVEEKARSGTDRAPIWVGAQNIHFEDEGAFTGEVSARMVLSAGGQAVILGHSERRQCFFEHDDEVGKKVERAVRSGLTPLLCVGETLAERDGGLTTSVVARQLAAGIAVLREAADLSRVVIAYEPVWAIGTGRNATPEEAEEVHRFLRSELGRAFESRGAAPERCEEALILYGGSVKPDNAKDLLSQPNVDGALVGGASLKAESFLKICAAAVPTQS